MHGPFKRLTSGRWRWSRLRGILNSPLCFFTASLHQNRAIRSQYPTSNSTSILDSLHTTIRHTTEHQTVPTSIKLSSRTRLSAHTIRDHLTDPRCLDSVDVPWRAEALSPEWLSPILCKGIVDAAVSSVRVEDASSGSSVRKRIVVSYNEAGQRAGLKTKFFCQDHTDDSDAFNIRAFGRPRSKVLRIRSTRSIH
jgi:hypothetical protein